MLYDPRVNSLSTRPGDLGWPPDAENDPDSLPRSVISQVTHHTLYADPNEVPPWLLDPDLVEVPPAR